MTDEAVQKWVLAYRDYAREMDQLAGQIENYDANVFFGDLDSLRQLSAGYGQLLKQGEGSLLQRVRQFSAAATQIADKLEDDWRRIVEADAESAASLVNLEFDW